jgi:hypothetical protein
MRMATIFEGSRSQESVKDWARRIAAQAPPLSDDQFHQLRALMVSEGTRQPAVQRKAA